MLQTDLKKIDIGWDNTIKSYSLNLDDDLDCFILFSSKDSKLADILYHKITDAIIDRIHPKNVYKDFSSALENINAFLRTWRHEDGKIKWFHAIIGLYNKKTFLFSTVWKASCYLYNSWLSIIEASDSNEKPKDFSFISSGDIWSWEVMILSTVRLLDILSQDDLADWLYGGDIKRSSDNIHTILLWENIGKNVWLITFRKQSKIPVNSRFSYEKISYFVLRACDNTAVKRILWYTYHLRDRILSQSKKVKQVLLWMWVVFSAIFLYLILSSFFQVANTVTSTESMKLELLSAQENIRVASQNMNDSDMFMLNITTAQEIIESLQSENLFLSDLQILQDRIWILQKQFNGIETFSTNSENTIYNFSDTSSSIVKILSVNNKLYVVKNESIVWPVISWQDAKEHIFVDMSQWDSFIDATIYDTNIVLLTSSGKVVNFAKNNFFSYVDVLDQAQWEKSPIIASYASNIYMLSDQQNQILMHRKIGQDYSAGQSYLTDEDSMSTGRILSIAIDGWIYMLKLDGSVVKLYRSPTYRLESLVLNNLPKNYNFDSLDANKLPSIRARANLSYVYMLLDNRILIFKPNTTNFRDTKSLNYIGQVEGKDIIINEFYVDNDGEIFVASSNWVYKMEFDIWDDGIIIK